MRQLRFSSYAELVLTAFDRNVEDSRNEGVELLDNLVSRLQRNEGWRKFLDPNRTGSDQNASDEGGETRRLLFGSNCCRRRLTFLKASAFRSGSS